MNFFKEINQLSVKYDTPSTRGCFNELVTLFTDYLKAVESQLKKPAQKSYVQQVKEFGKVKNFGPNDQFIRKHFPEFVETVNSALKQRIAEGKE